MLLDTGCIVALLDRSERYHEACKEALEELGAPLVTSEAVIAEACWLLRKLRGAADAVLRNVEDGIFTIPLPLASSTAPIRSLMKKYARVPMDLADACLVNLADELGTGRILTLDGDFRIYRWRRTRRFELLVDVD
ncbi:MAG TPA: PIN domain-containing protein [Polyangiaceae bacterium]